MTLAAIDDQESGKVVSSVLAAVNGGDRSVHAVRTAQTIAKPHSAALVIRCISAPDESGNHLEGAVSGLAKGAGCDDARLATYPDFFHDENAGRAHAICDEANGCDADLIVVGQHRAGTSGTLDSTLTERLLNESGRPVLIATGERNDPYRHALVAIDFSNPPQPQIEAAVAVAPEADLTLLHVVEESLARRLTLRGHAPSDIKRRERELQVLAKSVKRDLGFAGAMNVTVETGSAAKLIERKVSGEAPDLLVLGTRARSPIVRAALGSISYRFVKSPPCDVLLVKPHEGGIYGRAG